MTAGVGDPWFDQRKLTTGDDWQPVIEKALVSSDAAIICFSPNSVQKIGFVNAEIAKALEVADLQPEGTTFIMPVMFEPCEMPGRLARWQCAKLFEKNGFGSLIEGLRRRREVYREESPAKKWWHGLTSDVKP